MAQNYRVNRSFINRKIYILFKITSVYRIISFVLLNMGNIFWFFQKNMNGIEIDIEIVQELIRIV